MSNEPTPTEATLALVAVLKRSVLPLVLELAVAELMPTGPFKIAPAAPLLERVRAMQDDAELRFFLLERATLEEVMAAVGAFDLYAMELKSNPSESAEFRTMSGRLLGAPQALYVLQVGLYFAGIADGEFQPEQGG